MGMVDTLTKNILGWGSLGMLLVVLLIILAKFKNVSGVTSGINTTIDQFISGLSEPGNWVAIVVIALVGFGIVKLFSKKN